MCAFIIWGSVEHSLSWHDAMPLFRCPAMGGPPIDVLSIVFAIMCVA